MTPRNQSRVRVLVSILTITCVMGYPALPTHAKTIKVEERYSIFSKKSTQPQNASEKTKPKTPEKIVALTPAQIVASSPRAAFIDHIWLRESGRGSNLAGLSGYCLGLGKSNEFGFYPQGRHCFDNFAMSVKRLERWYDENKDLSDAQKLCYYNTGKTVSDCAYLGYQFSAMN